MNKPDLRYSTANTNLAACIGSLRIPLKPNQPVTIVYDTEARTRVVRFWFEDEGSAEIFGEVHKSRVIERYWNERETLELKNPHHPLVFMRAALDRRDWLSKAWHGRIMPAVSLAKAGYRTDDLLFASVLMASGFPLLRLNKPFYEFGVIPRTQFKVIKEEFDRFRDPEYRERPVSVMRWALEARALLVAATKDPRLETQLKFTDGQSDAEAGRMAFISDKATDQQISETIDQLHAS